MAWSQISSTFLQYQADASGTSASGYYLKCYAAGTTTPINVSLDDTGSTLVAKVELDSQGFAQNASGGSTAVYVDQSYRLVLYANSADADANTFANALQDVDNLTLLASDNITTSNGTSRSLEEWLSKQAQTYSTVAALVAETELSDGDYVIVESYYGDGVSGPLFGKIVAASTGTADGGEYIDLTGSSLQFNQYFDNNDRDVLKYGAKNDASADAITAFNAARAGAAANGGGMIIGAGIYYLSDKLSTDANERNAITIRGAGMSQTVLMFRGALNGASNVGVELLGTNDRFVECCVVDGDSYSSLPASTSDAVDPAPQRANITASTVGVRLDRNNVRCDNILSRGFESGFQHTNTKFYMVLYKCRATRNLYGHVSGSGPTIDTPNFNMSKDCHYNSNYAKNVWVRSGFHYYDNCSTEACTDYSASFANFPNGGIHIEAGGYAIFNGQYTENCNLFNANEKSVIRSPGNIWDCHLSAPVDIDRTGRGKLSNNMVKPPYYSPWAPTVAGAMTLDNSVTNLNDDRRYTRVTVTGAGGVSKVLASPYSTLVRGIRPRTGGGIEYKIKWGFWIRYVNDDFTTEKPEVNIRVRDTAGGDYAIADSNRLNIYDDEALKVNAQGGSGTVTTNSSTQLIDSGGTFTQDVKAGMTVLNTGTDRRARILNVVSDTTLDIDGDLFASGGNYAIAGWQYVGGITAVQNTVSGHTGVDLESIRLQITCESAAEDCSSTNRIFDISEPELRLLYSKSEGQLAYNEITPIVSIANVTNPPTDAEIDAIWGTPRQAGMGFEGLIDDNGAGTNVYLIRSDGTNWWYSTLTKAV